MFIHFIMLSFSLCTNGHVNKRIIQRAHHPYVIYGHVNERIIQEPIIRNPYVHDISETVKTGDLVSIFLKDLVLSDEYIYS